MNPQIPQIPSVIDFTQRLPTSVLPPLPQAQSFDVNYGGQLAGEQSFRPDVGLVSDLRSKLATGEIDFNRAAAQIIASAPNENLRSKLERMGNPEDIKKSLLQTFGNQSFIGQQGQTGHFDTKNYGFIPETTKNIQSRTSGFGEVSQIRALPNGAGLMG